jgi:hypothetical protein
MARNPLRGDLPPVSPDPGPRPGTLNTDLARLLEGIRQDKSNQLYEAFNKAAEANVASLPEAQWAVAMLQARVLAMAEMGGEQVWVAARFAEMVTAALPAMMLAVEQGRRTKAGKPAHDA